MKMPAPGDRVLIDSSATAFEVYRCSANGDHVYLGVISLETQRAREMIFTLEEFPKRVRRTGTLAEELLQPGACLSHQRFQLAIEALRIQSAHLLDPLFAINASQIDLLPHQADAVYRHILTQPRIRFLLADDPGLGKTIMAGLVLAELKARGAAERCLIVVPAHLREQWQREMNDWFQEDLYVLDSGTVNNASHPAFFQKHPQIVTSIDFAKRPSVRELLADQEWDFVVFDEAHKLAARRSGAEIDRTQRYQLGHAISPQARHLLFLTATPHSGDEWAYVFLLQLLEPYMFTSPGQLQRAAQQNGGLPFVLRRSKDHVSDLQGQKLFRNRTVETLSLEMTLGERKIYDAVTDYVRTWYPVSASTSGLTAQRRRNVALALTVLQRRVTSGMVAIHQSLVRRRQKLIELLGAWTQYVNVDQNLIDSNQEELDDQSAADREQLQQRLEGVTAARNHEELRAEIADLEGIIALVRHVQGAGHENKLYELRRVVETHLMNNPDEKLLVFSEFRDTVSALEHHLRSWGLQVAVIHGGMNMLERRQQEGFFRSEAQVMVATDAAAEGINLQFCRLLINYDLPWNPNRLEQRMGRIHRYGQSRDCFVWNVLYEDTREGDILIRLLAKIERMRSRPELGDTIYDVISVVLAGINLDQLIAEALLTGDSRHINRIIDVDIEDRIDEFVRLIHSNALAADRIDLSAIRHAVAQSQSTGLTTEDVECFTLTATEVIGGGLESTRADGVFRLGVPIDRQRQFSSTGYSPGMRVAFTRSIAQANGVPLLAPGNPIFDRLLEVTCNGSTRPVLAVLRGGVDQENGSFWVYRLKVIDGRDDTVVERLEAFFYRDRDGQAAPASLQATRSMRTGGPAATLPAEVLEAIEGATAATRRSASTLLDSLKMEALNRRSREASIKKGWLETSFEALISQSEQRTRELRRRETMGERNLRGAITNEERRRLEFIQERDTRLRELELESEIVVLAPELEAVAIVTA
jgi:superfamily II DNA or RNA helicase